jgi:hypothetical protein
MSGSSPRLSVVIPAKDGLAYLASAVESVLNQTFRDYELLVIDDYSEEDVLGSLAPYAQGDDRIRLLRNEGAPGISSALNTGLRHARGEFIARQDADDLSVPTRLARQLAFLQDNPSISIVGSFIRMIAPGGERLQLHREPVGPATVLFHSQVGTPFAHPAVMWRGAFFRQAGLDYADVAAEDFDLWARMLAAGARGDNIADELVLYRVSAKSVSNRRRAENAASADLIARSRIRAMTGQPPAEEFCRARFRAVVHAALTGNPVELARGDRIHLARAAELLRLNRAAGLFTLREQCSIEAPIASAYAQCDAAGPPMSSGTPPTLSAGGDPRAAVGWSSASRCSSVADHLQSRNAPTAHRSPRRYGSPTSELHACIPVYVPCFNNPTYLSMMVDQLLGLGMRNIIIIDGGSTFPPMLSYLGGLPDSITLIRLTENAGPRHLFREPSNYALLPDYFCLTDPDLQFNHDLPADFLAGLIEATQKYQIGKAGFSLDISDRDTMVADDLAFGARKFKIWEWEAQFWERPLSLTAGGDQIYRAGIDTTFAVYNKKYFDPASFLDAVRIGGRYTCRHLPWYRDKRLPADEEAYYRATARFSFFAADTAPAYDGPDVVAAGLTLSNDGFARIAGATGTGLFAVAATNMGASSRLIARLRLSDPAMPLTATICETDPQTGQCKAPPAATVTRTMSQNEHTTWSAFVHASGAIAQDPVRNRLILEFVDADGVVHGAASTAVTTEPAA